MPESLKWTTIPIRTTTQQRIKAIQLRDDCEQEAKQSYNKFINLLLDNLDV